MFLVIIWQLSVVSLRTISNNTLIMCANNLFTQSNYQLKINVLYIFVVWQGFKNLVMKKPRRDLIIYSRARKDLRHPLYPLHRGLAAKMAFEEGLNPLARFYWRDIFQN